jgi:hypothetical protein
VNKSFANGNGPNGTGPGSKPPEAAACSTSSWELTLGLAPRQFAS